MTIGPKTTLWCERRLYSDTNHDLVSVRPTLWWYGDDESSLDLDGSGAPTSAASTSNTLRFAKQALGWTTPTAAHTGAGRPVDLLILAALTQLRLARTLVADHRLPWLPCPPTRSRPAGFAEHSPSTAP